MDGGEESVTDLLALRLSSVPFHDIARPTLAYQEPQQGGEPGLTSMSAERWVPPAAALSFLGPLAPLEPARGLFSTRIPLLLSPASPAFPSTLVVLPDTLVVGDLAPEQPAPQTWLISGEMCMMGDELAIVAQSLYQQASGEGGQAGGSRTSQVSFSGHMNAIVAGDHVGWIYRRGSRSRATLGEALEVARDREAWENVDELGSLVQVSLADLEWLDVSARLGVKSQHHPSLWIRPLAELVSFKCRPSKTSDDHSRIISVSATLPLVGQLIDILRDPDDRAFSFFIQL